MILTVKGRHGGVPLGAFRFLLEWDLRSDRLIKHQWTVQAHQEGGEDDDGSVETTEVTKKLVERVGLSLVDCQLLTEPELN